MTKTFQKFLPNANLLSDDDVLTQLQKWQSEGQRTALVTLVHVEGTAPRQAGAQMIISEDGSFMGYLSGGCLEQAVVLEAQAVIKAGQNRQVRYGNGSPYFDVKLPCGSGLDLYFDQGIAPAVIDELLERRSKRQTSAMRTVLSSGVNTVEAIEAGSAIDQSAMQDGEFRRVYPCPLRLVLLGNGPALVAMALMTSATGIELEVFTSDDSTRAELESIGLNKSLVGEIQPDGLEQLDTLSAAVLFFHEHDQEPDLLCHLLKSNSFFIGAIGNHAVHNDRLEILESRGFNQSDLARIRAPIGLISGAKSKATLAIGVLAEMMMQAKKQNLVA